MIDKEAREKAIALGQKSDGKADNGKTKMGLVLVQFGNEVREVAEVLTYGAEKYPKPPFDDSWKDVPNGELRYADALYRHLDKIMVQEEMCDDETGNNHFAHAIANILFLWHLKNEKAKEQDAKWVVGSLTY